MPSSYVNKISKKKNISNERAEHLWNKAKELAADAGKAEKWEYITGIFKRMIGESLTFKEFCAILSEDGEPSMSVSGGGMDHHSDTDGGNPGKMVRRKKKCKKTCNQDDEEEKLTESTNKIMSMTRKFYDEIFMLEVDTTDNTSPQGKQDFAKAIENAKKKGARYVAMLSPSAVKYALSTTGALNNSIDIWANGYENRTSFIKQAERIKNDLTN